MDGLNKSKLRDNFTLKENILSIGIEIKKIFKDNSLKVSINNREYKIIGTIGLCHSIIDITDSEEINVGDNVILNTSPLLVNDSIKRQYI